MALQIRRGTAAEVAGFTPAEGEPIFILDSGRLVVGDGRTAGGIDVSTGSGLGGFLSSNINLNSNDIVGLGNIIISGLIQTEGSFEGNLTGNVSGSVFANESTLLVDAENGLIPAEVVQGTFTGTLAGDIISPLDESLILDAANAILYGSVIGNITGNVTGNILGNDTTILVESSTNTLNTRLLSLNEATIYTESEDGLRLAANNNSTVKVTIPLIAAPTTGGSIFTASPNVVEITSVRNTLDDPQDIESGDIIGCIAFNGVQTSTGTNNSSFIGFQCDPQGTTTQSHVPAKFIVVTNPAVSGEIPKFYTFNSLGRMGIGYENPQATLDVNGTLKLEKLTAEPDFATEGTMAIADGNTSGWDPKGTNLGKSYLCYFDGANWIPVF